MARKICHFRNTQLSWLPIFKGVPLLTDLGIIFNDQICNLLLNDLIEVKFVGIVINKLLAFHNFPLGHKKKNIGRSYCPS